MKYLNTREAAEKWGISVRRVTLLCNQDRVEGAFRFGDVWAIPEDAPKPIDHRKLRKENTTDKD